uniref:Uncharacterized protein n=1 Tax=Siphoviridae sp. ct0Xn2 TaxID=2826267 RepID=A0A8S5MUD0_9CAUD|nr:MAG TPA: hypothetical protein [Siphoviridae sp. ct0Xn2]
MSILLLILSFCYSPCNFYSFLTLPCYSLP